MHSCHNKAILNYSEKTLFITSEDLLDLIDWFQIHVFKYISRNFLSSLQCVKHKYRKNI